MSGKRDDDTIDYTLDDYARDEPVRPVRVAPQRISLRVSGARVGDPTRPAAIGAAAAGPIKPRPAARFGLRVHASRLAATVDTPDDGEVA